MTTKYSNDYGSFFTISIRMMESQRNLKLLKEFNDDINDKISEFCNADFLY